jgi:condensin complex subunit 1
LAETVERLARDFQCRSIVMDVVREITRLDTRELSRDTSGTRAFSQFLVEIAERVPEHLQPCISLLQLHLDGESYMLRKSILNVFMEIVLKLFSSENLEEAAKETRDQYLDCLEDHLHDVHAHVRSSVLQSWSKLCNSKAIPLNRQIRLLKMVVGRLRDRLVKKISNF